VGEVRGRGLMIGVELVEPGTVVASRAVARYVLEACRQQGLLIGTGGLRGNVLRIAPAMSVTMDEATEAVEVLVGALVSADQEFAGRGKR
jgi:4-aminobutyrate aminotransferase